MRAVQQVRQRRTLARLALHVRRYSDALYPWCLLLALIVLVWSNLWRLHGDDSSADQQNSSISIHTTLNDNDVSTYSQLSLATFSVSVGTFGLHRLHYLYQLLDGWTENPLVDAVHVTWHDQSADVPSRLTDYSKVSMLHPHSNSLNNRFLPLLQLQTHAVYVCDDDIDIASVDLNFAFSVWQTRQQQLVGFFPRSHVQSIRDADHDASDSDAQQPSAYEYLTTNLTAVDGQYSMLLTKGFFTHARYIDMYAQRVPAAVLQYIDRVNNCEDIAFNMMVSQVTGQPPVAIAPTYPLYDFGLTDGLSAKTAEHIPQRHQCMTQMAALCGGMTLQYSNQLIGSHPLVVQHPVMI